MTGVDLDRVADLQRQRDVFGRSPFLQHLGFRLESVEPGRAQVVLEAGSETANRHGAVHGGVMATLIDTVLSQAIHTRVGTRTSMVTIQLTVNYLRPGRLGRLVATAEVLQVSSRIAVATATVVDQDGEQAAFGVGSFRLFREPA